MPSILKSKIITIVLILLLGFTSCHRKDLYLRVDTTQITVDITDIRLNILWGIDWETQWHYDWDESYGDIGYTRPDLIKGTIYNVHDHKRFSSFIKIFDADGGRVSLTAGSTYDMMFYNFGTEWTSFYQSDDYESLTASTRVEMADGSRALFVAFGDHGDYLGSNGENGKALAESLGLDPMTHWTDAAKQLGIPLYAASADLSAGEMSDALYGTDGSMVYYSMGNPSGDITVSGNTTIQVMLMKIDPETGEESDIYELSVPVTLKKAR